MHIVPVFIDESPEDQVQALLKYFKELGADISEEKPTKGIEDDLTRIINACDICFKEGSEADVEIVLNDIVSIIILIPLERAEKLIHCFCEKLVNVENQSLSTACLRALWLLFQAIDESSPIRFYMYGHLISLSDHTNSIKSIYHDLAHFKEQFSLCPQTMDQLQKIYRQLHAVLVKCNESKEAAKIMMELLSTYTDKNATHARNDAIRCIVTSIADPNTFLLDPLLSLKPVKILEGEPVFVLLNIFVSGSLNDYLKFYKDHKDFITAHELNHENNIRKMRLLTFMQLAENNSDIKFETIQKQLDIKEENLEEFIIQVLKTKLVRARMDQVDKKVFITSTMHRTFDKAQWQHLCDLLHSWKTNLMTVQESMKSINLGNHM